MTNPNSSLIAVVLDRSGSMGHITGDTIGGFNKFLEDRCKEPGDVRMTLVQFDDKYELNFSSVNVKQVKPLNAETYVARGGTALLDAVGKTIFDVGQTLKAMPEHERPGKVCCLIITDGEENSSKEYTHDRVKKMIDVQRSQFNWEFIFLGADMNAVSTGTSMGMTSGTSMAYTASGQGILRAFNATSQLLGGYVQCASYQGMAFSSEDRAANAPLSPVLDPTDLNGPVLNTP